MKVIIPVAGWGTRFLPATKAQPKEMLSVVDKPVIQWIVEQITAAGFEDIIFVTGRNKRSLEDHFDNHSELENVLEKNGKLDQLSEIKKISNLARFTFVRQSEALGNGDAVKRALYLVNHDPVAVSWGDEILISNPPIFKTLQNLFEKFGLPVLAIKKAPKSQLSKYGVVKIKKTRHPNLYRVTGIIEKPDIEKAPSSFISIGSFILTAEVYKYLDKLYPPPKNKEIYLTEAINLYLQNGGKALGFEFKGRRYDCGSKFGLLQAQVELGLEHPEIKHKFRNYLRSIAQKI
mgnify:CR=1 FL=1